MGQWRGSNNEALRDHRPDRRGAGFSVVDGVAEMNRELWLYNLIADNKPLPKGTRINTTEGGVPTGGNHELSDNLLKAANKVPNHLSDYVPFWILGWRDLHDELLPPIEDDK